MADKSNVIKPRKLTGALQVELLELAAARAEDTTVSQALRRWADGIIEDMSMFDLAFICDVDINVLMALDMDDLNSLVNETKKANPLFFSMLERESKFTRDMMERYPDLVQKFAVGKLNSSENASLLSAETGTELA